MPLIDDETIDSLRHAAIMARINGVLKILPPPPIKKRIRKSASERVTGKVCMARLRAEKRGEDLTAFPRRVRA